MIINITYDSSVNSAPSAFKTAVSTAVQFLENIFVNPITINIDVGFGEVNGQALDNGALGESEGLYNKFSYTQVRNALVQNATSADQISAANSLPAADPTNGGNYWVTTAEAKALGLMGASSAIDGFVGFSSTATFDFDDSNGVTPGTYDFNGTFLHEMTETMGRVLFVGTDGIGANAYTPEDLFHYSSSGVRDFIGTQAGYFSPNGGNTNLDNFNTNPNGDFGDWASSLGFNDSFLAFSNSGVVNPVTQNDLRLMNVLGYNESTTTPLPNPGSSWRVIGTGDFNADSHSDILWQNADGSPSIWEMNGSSVIGWVSLPNPGPTWHVIGTGDFNADSHSDILWQNADGSPSIWEMNGSSVVGWVALPNPGPSWHVIGTGDFNADSHSDILWQNNDGTPAVWLSNGGTIAASGTPLPNPGPSWHVIGTGDFNADGHSDILWQNNDGSPSIWEMNGNSVIGWVSLPNPGPTWHVIGTGDFNNDGHSDILWQNNDGSPSIWEMNGSSVIGWVSLPNPGPSWHIKGTGDFNDDNHTDILWQNNDGTPAVWLMNGSSVIAASGASLSSSGTMEQPKNEAPAGGPMASQPTLFPSSEAAATQVHPTIGSSG